jgi:hypothetical protein
VCRCSASYAARQQAIQTPSPGAPRAPRCRGALPAEREEHDARFVAAMPRRAMMARASAAAAISIIFYFFLRLIADICCRRCRHCFRSFSLLISLIYILHQPITDLFPPVTDAEEEKEVQRERGASERVSAGEVSLLRHAIFTLSPCRRFGHYATRHYAAAAIDAIFLSLSAISFRFRCCHFLLSALRFDAFDISCVVCGV